MSNFPQQAPRYTFSRGDELSSTTKYTPETSTSSRRWWCFFFFFWVFLDSLWPIYPKNVIFQIIVGGTDLTSHFLRAVFESPWDSRSWTLSDFLNIEKVTKTGQKPSPGRHREFRNLWNPLIRFNKTGRETLPLAIPHVKILTILRKTKFR